MVAGYSLSNLHNKALFDYFQGIIKRDEFVFEMCKSYKVPIVMLTSGGYLKKTAKIVADSIMNLHKKGLITGDCTGADGKGNM